MKATCLLAMVAICGACASPVAPTAPSPTLGITDDGIGQAPRLDRVTPIEDAMPPSTALREVPAWQQEILDNVIADLTARAIAETRRTPGIIVLFEIHAPSSSTQMASTHIAGELRNPKQSRSGYAIFLSYTLIHNSLSFPDKYTFLHALETAVTYKAEVRLVGGEITCCPDKPVIAVTGRFEGDF